MITIIGTGNVAWHLAKAFEAAGCKINEIYGRNVEDAHEIADELYHAAIVGSLDFSESASELFVLAVSDNAIATVTKKLILPEGSTLVHTSGSQPLSVLREVFDGYSGVQCGVFYPLMTFTKHKPVDFKEVPFCIESDDRKTEKFLEKIAQKISNSVTVVSSEQRKVLHLAAVFACNFTNHLLAVSQEIAGASELEFKLLKPLIRETFQKVFDAEHAADVQTGPALRHDTITLSAHRQMLKDDAGLRQVYDVLTKSIQTFFA